MADLSTLVTMSRRYGSNPEWVLAGGGNTSFKDADRLYVKASGYRLGTIQAEGFCSIDRGKLSAIWEKTYPEATEAREAAALADLLAARSAGETKRPSVETLMHGLFPQAYVVHTHPSVVNGLTCGRGGREVFERLFADEGIWIPFIDPGYLLAHEVRQVMEDFKKRRGSAPKLMFLQNHGLLVAAETPEEIDKLSLWVRDRVLAEVGRLPDLGAFAADAMALQEATLRLQVLAAQTLGEGFAIRFRCDAEILKRATSFEAFRPLSSAFTPDHIVYASHEFLLVVDASDLSASWKDFQARNLAVPKVLVLRGLGAFSCGKSAEAAESAMALFVDACKIAAYAESFGGASHMSAEKIDFIRHWEVEQYRASLAGR